MLKTLYIRDFAIIDELTVEFAGGLNIITGETGAGKSILIEALRLLLGERASGEDVRQGRTKAVVEGFVSIEKNDAVHGILLENGYEDGDELIIRREIAARGGSRAFLNDSPAPIGLLREIGDRLIDLHGQHDHQMLLRPETHCRLLDNAGGLDELVERYAKKYAELRHLAGEIRKLRAREDELHRTLEFHEFQLEEIREIDPQPDEIDTLNREVRIRENSEQLYELVNELHDILYGQKDAVRDRLVRARSMLERLADIDSSFSERRDELASTVVVVEELARYLQSYSLDIDFAPQELETMRERIQALNGLRKKYGGSLEAVFEHREKIEQEISLSKNYDSTISQREEELRELRKSTGRLAAKLSRKRRQVATAVEKSIVETLRELGIESGQFCVRIDRRECEPEDQESVIDQDKAYHSTSTGIDDVEFYVSTNAGEDPKPLARTASGGEISRIMLGLKSILAKNDRLPLLVFDEIDTGISGRIAQKVGGALRNLADFHQIVAITHLPQIAAMSHHHFVVEKSERDGRTVTTIRRLDQEEHTTEVARLVSGEDVTESSIRAARELMEE